MLYHLPCRNFYCQMQIKTVFFNFRRLIKSASGWSSCLQTPWSLLFQTELIYTFRNEECFDRSIISFSPAFCSQNTVFHKFDWVGFDFRKTASVKFFALNSSASFSGTLFNAITEQIMIIRLSTKANFFQIDEISVHIISFYFVKQRILALLRNANFLVIKAKKISKRNL